jgi:hypothetical protein
MFEFHKIRINDLSKFLKPTEEYVMALQDALNAAKAAVDAVHIELDAANAKLNEAQAAMDAAVPHLSLLAEIEGYAAHIPAEIVGEFNALIAKARALF